MEKNIQSIVDWLHRQVEISGTRGLVVGISGGLDSAVVAYLMKRAFGNKVLGVIMPIHTKPDDLKDAKAVVNGCDIPHITIDLTEAHTQLYGQIENKLTEMNDFSHENDQMASANLRARLRMSTLYTLASHYQYLVVGTDNASEWYTGYFTKYGDGGVDIQPITDFTKEEVRDLGKALGVPDSIINKRPSADLWEGQTDEAEMGTTYDRIDAYLKKETIPDADRSRIERMHARTEHKRNPLPRFVRDNTNKDI